MRIFKGLLMSLCAAVLALASAERAGASVDFTLTGVTFSNVQGANEGFRWSVSGVGTPLSIGSLEVNQTSDAFTYGRFSTTDFGLDLIDLLDNNDRFTVNLAIEPPNPAERFTAVGSPDASLELVWTWRDGVRLLEYVDVNFSNDPYVVSYADGLRYAVRFLDSARLYEDGTLDLQAQLTLLSEASATGGNSVPEPAAYLVWTVLGMAFGYRVHRSRSKRSKL